MYSKVYKHLFLYFFMKLISDRIVKNLEMGEEFFIKRNYKKTIWRHIIAVTYSRAFLGMSDSDFRLRNKLWRRFFVAPESIDSKRFEKLWEMIAKDTSIINGCLKKISKINEESGYDYGDIYKPTKTLAPVGVLAIEILD